MNKIRHWPSALFINKNLFFLWLGQVISQAGDSTEDCLSAKDKGLFLSTEWDVPYATDVNNMHEVMRVVRDVQSY